MHRRNVNSGRVAQPDVDSGRVAQPTLPSAGVDPNRSLIPGRNTRAGFGVADAQVALYHELNYAQEPSDATQPA